MFSPSRLLLRAHEFDLALFRRVARSENETLDLVLPRLTSAADNSRLWMVLAAALFLTGRREPRRAALRGLLSVAATSALVNGPLKMIGRRTRPILDLVPSARRALRIPVTTSFPSGHTASAFAFATGATMELPLLAPLLYPLALGVGVSRVYTGVHYPGDVFAGAAVGAGIAAFTRQTWPVPPAIGVTAEPSSIPVEDLPGPDGSGLTIVLNEASGDGRSSADRLRALLPAARVTDVDPDDGGSLSRALEAAAGDSKAVGIYGGDGSVNSAARIAVEHDVPLLCIPGGTLDHFAKALGIESMAMAAASLQDRNVVSVDVGLIADRPFLNTASLGSYVELVETRERLEKRLGKWPALVVALVHVLRHSEPEEVEIDGDRKRLWLAFIGNCHYRPSGFGPSWRERLDDGLLDLRYVEAGEPWARTRLIGAVLTGRLGRCRVYSQVLVPRFRLSLRGPGAWREQGDERSPFPLARDGEIFEAEPDIIVTKSERRLKVFVPRR